MRDRNLELITRMEVWKREKYCYWPKVFQVLQTSDECFYNLLATVRKCFLPLLENPTGKRRESLFYFNYQNVNSLFLYHHF